MKVKNKRNGTNTLAYRDGVSVIKVIISSGSIVDIVNLKKMSQVINSQDFNRGWFEVIEEKEKKEEVFEKIIDNTLEKAQQDAKKYSLEEKK